MPFIAIITYTDFNGLTDYLAFSLSNPDATYMELKTAVYNHLGYRDEAPFMTDIPYGQVKEFCFRGCGLSLAQRTGGVRFLLAEDGGLMRESILSNSVHHSMVYPLSEDHVRQAVHILLSVVPT